MSNANHLPVCTIDNFTLHYRTSWFYFLRRFFFSFFFFLFFCFVAFLLRRGDEEEAEAEDDETDAPSPSTPTTALGPLPPPRGGDKATPRSHRSATAAAAPLPSRPTIRGAGGACSGT